MEQKAPWRKAGRRLTTPALVTLSLLAAAAPITSGEETGSPLALEVRISGFESDSGRLAIALFANERDYSTQTNAIRKSWLEIRGRESHWRLEALPAGEYALIAYHDENDNGEIDLRALGMPKEPVGVSNDARGLFGPPRFRAAKFTLTAPLTRHEIVLR